jgi:K+-transporting ATPase A subunit
MLEAGCLEWALLVAVVLRDAMAVVRTVNTASMTDTPLEIVARMREGLSFVELWANTEWWADICFVLCMCVCMQLRVFACMLEQDNMW